MAGRPKLQKLTRDIERIGTEEEGFETGEDWILDLIADGWVMRRVCDELTKRTGDRITRPQLQAWIKLEESRRPKVDTAREFSAWTHAEESGEILDELHEKSKTSLLTAPDVSLAKERSGWKRWYASKLNPNELGDKASTEIHLHAGDLHLDALMAASKQAKALNAAPTGAEKRHENIQEAEVISIEDDPLADLL